MNSELTRALLELADKLVPQKVICRYSKPWYNREMSEQLQKQREAKKKWRKRKSPSNYAAYQSMLRQTEQMLEAVKASWWEHEVSKLDTAPQVGKWKIINKLTRVDVQGGIQPIKVNDGFVFEDDEILKEMEHHHIYKDCDYTVSVSDLSGADDQIVCMEDTEQNGPSDQDVQFAPITDTEISATFGCGTNTPGPDGISAQLINIADRLEMSKCLGLLWNEVWKSGRLPPEWKLEHRVLLPKFGKESYNDCSAYRTVSLTDILGKRLEKIVVNRLVGTLDVNGFDENQFAYLKHRSATQAVLALTESIKRNSLNNRLTGVVFFDLKDAFGSVNRKKLLEKLGRDFKVSSHLLSYIRDFLSSRFARIKVNDLIGDWIESEWGTSAGTVIGPILFIAYAHDTPTCIQLKFADEMVGYTAGDDESEVQSQLQSYIDETSQWAKTWDLELNASKTKTVLFGHKSSGRLQLNLNGSLIVQVPEFKYLGVILDEQLKFECQAEYAASKARRALSRVCR